MRELGLAESEVMSTAEAAPAQTTARMMEARMMMTLSASGGVAKVWVLQGVYSRRVYGCACEVRRMTKLSLLKMSRCTLYRHTNVSCLYVQRATRCSGLFEYILGCGDSHRARILFDEYLGDFTSLGDDGEAFGARTTEEWRGCEILVSMWLMRFTK